MAYKPKKAPKPKPKVKKVIPPGHYQTPGLFIKRVDWAIAKIWAYVRDNQKSLSSEVAERMIGEIVTKAIEPCIKLNEAMAVAYRNAEEARDVSIRERDETIADLRRMIENVRNNRDITIKELRQENAEFRKLLNRKPNASVLDGK